MKYNTFWGYFFWCALLISALMDLRPLALNVWNLVYNGTLMDVNIFLWLLTNSFILFLLVLKLSLLRLFFPLNKHRLYATGEICSLCALLSTLYAVIILVIVIFIGGLKNFEGLRLLQLSSVMLTPFIFIYYLNKEG